MWQCPKCKEQVEDQFTACWKCGTGQDGSTVVGEQEFQAVESGVYEATADAEMADIYADIESNYPSHGIVADLLQILAWILALLGVLGAVLGVWIASKTEGFGIILVIECLLAGAVGCLITLSLSMILRMLGSIDKNTQLTVALLQKKRKR